MLALDAAGLVVRGDSFRRFQVATAYVRLRMLWGALDFTEAQGQTPTYSSSQIVAGGPSAAVASGVGVRRCSIVIDRTSMDAGADPAFIHFDFLNTTSGSPDDTWTTGDYTAIEALLQSWMTPVSNNMPTGLRFTEMRWHRAGTGVSKPNPAERVTILATPVSAGGAPNAPQVATSITFRTGVRKSWGRTYIPLSGSAISSSGRVSNAVVDAIANATNTLVTGAASADFHLVVVSSSLASALNVEHIEVDDVSDVIRRRRWKQTKYRKILP